MTSLPISANWIEGAANPPAPRIPEFAVGAAQAEDENALLRAFRSFARTARSLEQSYRQLQAEVERLRRELAQKEGDLAASAEERNNERARLIRILEGLPCGVLVIFDNGKIWKANPEARRLLDADHLPAGLDSVAALPAPCSSFSPPAATGAAKVSSK